MDEEMKIQEISRKIGALAEEITIHDRRDLQNIIGIIQKIREHREKIVKYWRSAKESAFLTYKQIVAREKEMLAVCESAEEHLRCEILYYVKIQKSKAEKLRLEAEKSRKKDVEKLLAESEQLKQNGDEKNSEVKRKQAEKIQNLPVLSDKIFCPEDGFSLRKNWHVKITDKRAVPAYFGAHEIRPIDAKRLLEIRRKNSEVKIPGVEFYQSESLMLKNAEMT